MSDVNEQIKEMAKLTILSGRISEVQKKNMEMYPMVFFNGIKSVKIDYDLERLDNVDERNKDKLIIGNPNNQHFIRYDMLVEDNADNGTIDIRFLALETAIRSLFWRNVKVIVHINGKLVKESSDVRR